MNERRFWPRSPFDVPLLPVRLSKLVHARLLRRDGVAGSEDEEVARADTAAGDSPVRRFTRNNSRRRCGWFTSRTSMWAASRRCACSAPPVEMTLNAEKPDLVVVTGDFVCHSQEYLDALEEIMSQIEAPVIGVLGNHDYWSGANEVRRALKRANVEVLDNAHTIITLRGQRLQGGRRRRCVYGSRRSGARDARTATRSPGARPVAYRRGGGRTLEPERATGAVRPHSCRSGHSRRPA